MNGVVILSDEIEANLKIAVAMRAVRGALGVSQGDFAAIIGVSKPTIARIETLEVAMRLETYTKILKTLKEMGVTVDTIYTDSVHVEFEPEALEMLKQKLADPDKRRQGRLQQGIGVETRKQTRKIELGDPPEATSTNTTEPSSKAPSKKEQK